MSARNIPTSTSHVQDQVSVTSGGKSLIEEEEISATRDFSFDEAQLLAKEREQEILREALARDLVALVMRRLAALVSAGPTACCASAATRILRSSTWRALWRRTGVLRAGRSLPGSYWGESEAGLRGNTLYVRADTPVHSLLHELSHYVCMAPGRRQALDRDAGGDDAEECAVCYLQILLADETTRGP